MILIRSIVFNALFYLNLLALMVFGLPTMLFGPHAIMGLAKLWGRTSLWLLRVVCGLDVEYRGLENIPHGGYIIAPKHQSIWETFALLPLFPDFSFILKRELTWIPFFGWYLVVGRQIAINRSSGKAALVQATRLAAEVVQNNRQVFIFPEGTRRPAGAPPDYKFGVVSIYERAQAPCLPIALNSGLFWPRRSFVRRPGKVLVEIMAPIPPNLPRQDFVALLSDRIETATNRLITESITADPSLRVNLQGAIAADGAGAPR